MTTGEFLAQDWPAIAIIVLGIAILIILFWPEDESVEDTINKMAHSITGIWPFSRSASRTDEITQTAPMKRYIQLKDSHIAKKGMIWEAYMQNNNQYIAVTPELLTVSREITWREPKYSIEGNIEWFEELIPVYVNKDMMQSISSLALKSGK